MLLRLRILGKFLGYLFFSPYSHTIPRFYQNELAEIRNNCQTPLDLCSMIEVAAARRHLLLTVPCVIEFLSMMDEHACRYFLIVAPSTLCCSKAQLLNGLPCQPR